MWYELTLEETTRYRAHTDWVTACNGKRFELCPNFMSVPLPSYSNLHIVRQSLSREIPLWADVIVGCATNNTEEPLNA